MNRYLRYAVAAAFAAGSMASSVAHAVLEIEGSTGNDSLATAQRLEIVNGSAEVTGAIGATTTSVTVTNDVDLYSFEATAGDVVTIDIDGAMKDFMDPRPLDTVIAVFAADGTILRENDDADEIDVGSSASNDSFIVDFVVPANGKYYIGVGSTGSPIRGMSFVRKFVDGGALDSTNVDPDVGNGSYTLIVSGVNPPPPVAEAPTEPPAEEPGPGTTPPGQAKKVNIDIRPRHSGVAKVYPNADGRISVAVLSSTTFNAMKVDRYSMTFGAEGSEASYVGCHKDGIDVNRDGRKDLVCRFDVKKASFEVGELEGVLKGTAEGSQFEGRAPLKVVVKGKKRKHHHHHHGRDHDNRGHGSWHSNRGRD